MQSPVRKHSNPVAYAKMADEDNIAEAIDLGDSNEKANKFPQPNAYDALPENEEDNNDNYNNANANNKNVLKTPHKEPQIGKYDSILTQSSIGGNTDNEMLTDTEINTDNYKSTINTNNNNENQPINNNNETKENIIKEEEEEIVGISGISNNDKNESKEKEKEKEIEQIKSNSKPMYRQRTESMEDEKEKDNSVLLFQLLDKDQDVVEKTKNKKNPDSVLNKVDPDWDYNITIGDVEKRRVSELPGKDPTITEELWFPVKKSVRKVFIALKVKRVSEVDNVAETFRMRFHIYFNWLMTEADYRSYLEAKTKVESTKNYDYLMKWEPSWYPHLEFQNAIEEHTKEWEVYPEQGRFRLQDFKDFAKEKNEKLPENVFDCQHAKFIRAKLECEMTFAEELELQSFPFDCQDLSCIIHERTTGGVKCRFLPELRKPSFASVDPRYSVIDEWDLETAILEFGDANASASRSKTSYAMIILRLKMKRRWKVFLWNIVFLMMCICALALTAFALDSNNLGERLNLVITLVLTTVAFSYVVFDNLPNVPYLTFMDKYILSSYGFLVCTMVQSAFTEFWGDKDYWFFIAGCIIFLSYHIGFAYYAKNIRVDEENKLYLSSDDVEREVNLSRPALEFNYEQRLRAGDNGRLLSFLGTLKIPDSMSEEEKEQLRISQQKLKNIYEERAQKLNNDAQHFHQNSMKQIGSPTIESKQ